MTKALAYLALAVVVVCLAFGISALAAVGADIAAVRLHDHHDDALALAVAAAALLCARDAAGVVVRVARTVRSSVQELRKLR